jgi:hypothetical protein
MKLYWGPHACAIGIHIPDLSRDEPFIIPLPKGEICAVPYTAHLNDLHNLLDVYDLAQFELLLKEEFDQRQCSNRTSTTNSSGA